MPIPVGVTPQGISGLEVSLQVLYRSSPISPAEGQCGGGRVLSVPGHVPKEVGYPEARPVPQSAAARLASQFFRRASAAAVEGNSCFAFASKPVIARNHLGTCPSGAWNTAALGVDIPAPYNMGAATVW